MCRCRAAGGRLPLIRRCFAGNPLLWSWPQEGALCCQPPGAAENTCSLWMHVHTHTHTHRLQKTYGRNTPGREAPSSCHASPAPSTDKTIVTSYSLHGDILKGFSWDCELITGTVQFLGYSALASTLPHMWGLYNDMSIFLSNKMLLFLQMKKFSTFTKIKKCTAPAVAVWTAGYINYPSNFITVLWNIF